MKILATSCLIFLTSCGGGSNHSCSVELNSDSIFVTSGSTISPVAILQQLNPSIVIDNRAVGGLTTRDLISGYTTTYAGGPIPPRGAQKAFYLESHPSDIIIIETGGNDGFEGVTVDSYRAYLIEFIRVVRSQGKTPIITGIVPVEPGPVFNESVVSRIRELNAVGLSVAKEFNVEHSGFGEMSYDPKTDSIDGIHRSEKAIHEVVAILTKSIQKVCKL